MGFLDRFRKNGSSERTEILEIEDEPLGPNKFVIDEIYIVQGFPVLKGRVLSGRITVDNFTRINEKTCNIAKMQLNKKDLKEVIKGEQCAMILTKVNQHNIRENQILEFF